MEHHVPSNQRERQAPPSQLKSGAPPTFGALIAHIEVLVPLQWAEQGDSVGRVCGDLEMPITGLLFALDLTESAINHAAEAEANCIFVHHPPLYRLANGEEDIPMQAMVDACAARGIAVYCAHTNLDSGAVVGTVPALAQALGAEVGAPLLPIDFELGASPLPSDSALPPLGLGFMARFPQGIAVSEFLVKCRALSDCVLLYPTPEAPRHNKAVWPDKPRHNEVVWLKEPLRTIALWPGAGLDIPAMRRAIAMGAQALVTGEVKLNIWREAAILALPLLTLGHYESEWPGLESLRAALDLEQLGVYYSVVHVDFPYHALPQ